MAAGKYSFVIEQGATTNFQAIGAQTNPVRPATPSLIVRVIQVA